MNLKRQTEHVSLYEKDNGKGLIVCRDRHARPRQGTVRPETLREILAMRPNELHGAIVWDLGIGGYDVR